MDSYVEYFLQISFAVFVLLWALMLSLPLPHGPCRVSLWNTKCHPGYQSMYVFLFFLIGRHSTSTLCVLLLTWEKVKTEQILHLGVFCPFLPKGEIVPRTGEDFPPWDHPLTLILWSWSSDPDPLILILTPHLKIRHIRFSSFKIAFIWWISHNSIYKFCDLMHITKLILRLIDPRPSLP